MIMWRFMRLCERGEDVIYWANDSMKNKLCPLFNLLTHFLIIFEIDRDFLKDLTTFQLKKKLVKILAKIQVAVHCAAS